MSMAKLLLLGMGSAGGGGGGSGPSGPPTNASEYDYGSPSKLAAQWTNGDATAATRIYWYDTSGGCPSVFPDDLTFLGQAGVGATSYETSRLVADGRCSLYIVHYKDGQFSTWVQVTDTDGGSCVGC